MPAVGPPTGAPRGQLARRDRPPARAQPRRGHARAGRARRDRRAAVPDGREPHARSRSSPRSSRSPRSARRSSSSPATSTSRSRRSMGLVAYCVARHPRAARCSTPPAAIVVGHRRSGSSSGWSTASWSPSLRVPSIVATLGTLSIFRGIDYLIAGSHQVPLAGLPPGFTDAARDAILGIPLFVLRRGRRRRHRDGGPALDAVRPAGLRGRQQPRGRRDPRHPVAAGRLRRVRRCAACSPASPGVMWVIQFGTINGTAATGVVLAVVAAVVVGGVNIFGGSGTRRRRGASARSSSASSRTP